MARTFGWAALLAAALAAEGCTSSGVLRQAEQAQTNTQVVVGFVTTALDQHQVQTAFDRYVGPTYKQHDPAVADGREAAIAALDTAVTTLFPKGRFYVKRTVAQGDLVFIHGFWDQRPGETPGEVAMDVFRLDRGKIIEHWGVSEPIAVSAAHSNTPF
jgi:predicted SnoaL-like aldol condensation-catalyzing enzyme